MSQIKQTNKEGCFDKMSIIAENGTDVKKIKEYYDNWAPTYTKDFRSANYFGPQRGAEKLAEYVTDKTANIIDAGCGVGNVGIELTKLGYTNMDGIDLSPESIEFSKRLNIYQKLRIDKLGDNILDINDNSYDALISIGTFIPGHVNQSAFGEFIRVVKPGGFIVIGMREEFLNTCSQFRHGALERDMQRFVDQKKWNWTLREIFPNFFAGKTGVHFVFQIL